MQFPEVTQWSANLVALLQYVGGALVAVCIGILAIIMLTSFGSEHKIAFVRTASITIVIGIFVLAAAPRIAATLQGLVAFLQK
jgi:hypothetical protein